MTRAVRSALSGDRKAVAVAVLCLIHCVAGPALLSFAGFASLIGVSEGMEPVFVLSSLAIGTVTLIPGYRHKHGRFSCLALFFAGMVCLALLRSLRWLVMPDGVLGVVGAGLIVTAHLTP